MAKVDDELRQVRGYLTFWTSGIKIANATGLYDINKVSEGIAQQVLNMIYGYQLKDLNRPKINFPGIDLGDQEHSMLAFQVTSAINWGKINQTIDTFKSYQLYGSYTHGLKFFVLGDRKRIRPVVDDDINFNSARDIIFVEDLMEEISDLYYNDQSRFQSVKTFLAREFPAISNEDDSVAPRPTLPSIRTDLIILEIDRIWYHFNHVGNDWHDKSPIFKKLTRFLDHSNEHVADRVFAFIEEIYDLRNEKNAESKASDIKSMLLDFLPKGLGNGNPMGVENGRTCCHIGHDFAYDGLIHLNDLRVATHGLWIMKYVYRLGKRNGIEALVDYVHAEYDHLQMQLDRPERNDLGNAQQLTSIFRTDLDAPGMFLPKLPTELMILV
ncbi:SMEK domain-containing protein [Pedobacter sp.]